MQPRWLFSDDTLCLMNIKNSNEPIDYVNHELKNLAKQKDDGTVRVKNILSVEERAKKIILTLWTTKLVCIMILNTILI